MSSPVYPFKFSGYGRNGTAGLFSAFKVVALEAAHEYGETKSFNCRTPFPINVNLPDLAGAKAAAAPIREARAANFNIFN